MSDDLAQDSPLLVDAPPAPKARKKPAAKKAPAKKAAAKKTASNGADDPAKPKKTTRKKAASAKTDAPAEAELPLEPVVAGGVTHSTPEATSHIQADEPAPVPPADAPPTAREDGDTAPVTHDQKTAAPTADAPAAAQEDDGTAPAAHDQSHAAAPAPTPAAEMSPHDRRKSKWERWKERRERMRQERRERAQARAGTTGNGEAAPTANGDAGQDYERPPERPLGPPEPAEGILEMSPKGYGFLRQRDRGFAQHPQDAFISADFIRQYGLREGMLITGTQQKGPRGPQITEVKEVNARAPEAMRDLPLFEELKAINPSKRIQLETTKDRLTTRVIDMFTPVGRGQRGLIVAPPRAGKTTLLQHIAEAVVANHPATHLMILLVDERPEEVTEFKRVLPTAEIFASSNDQDIKNHTRIAAFAIERAKRLVECGEHVFMLLDSITRMARAFNNAKQGGATMSGGMGVGAMEIPRRLFAAARNTRGAGSLTILATALIETGSRMDDLIFQEFKGTGNMELVLDRKIAEQFYYPAVNIFKSGTRREELLLQPFQLDKIHMLRRGLAGHKPIDAIQRVLTLMERYPSNAQMLVDLPNK